MKKLPLFLLGILLCSLAAGPALARQDAFGEGNKIESEHFTIEYKNGIDLNALADGLKVSATDEQLTGLKIDRSSPEKQLASKIEILFNRAGDVLDMHVYSLKSNIKVFADHHQLVDFFHTMFQGNLPCMGLSFYLVDYDSIYVSAASFRREILGHEMGHAIMSHYFVVQPSIRIQEVLAGYVEYQLRKSKE
jgi:hypothetical protein